MNPYNILRIEPDVYPHEIKNAYRHAANRTHPDKPGGSDEAFQEVKLAYDILSDPERRARYDETGETEPKQPSIAENRLIALFNAIVSDEKFDGNIIETCAEYVEQAADELKVRIARQTAKHTKLQEQLGRVTSTGELNLYEQLLSESLARIDQQLTASKTELSAVDELREMLKEYSDSRPVAVPPRFTHFNQI